MLHGCFLTIRGTRYPALVVTLTFAALPGRSLRTAMVLDTGAAVSALGRRDLARLAIDPFTLPRGRVSAGIGGRARTRLLDATARAGGRDFALQLRVFEPVEGAPLTPSILGQDFIGRFTLVQDGVGDRVLLLDPDTDPPADVPWAGGLPVG